MPRARSYTGKGGFHNHALCGNDGRSSEHGMCLSWFAPMMRPRRWSGEHTSTGSSQARPRLGGGRVGRRRLGRTGLPTGMVSSRRPYRHPQPGETTAFTNHQAGGGQLPAVIWLLLQAGERPKEKPLRRGRTGDNGAVTLAPRQTAEIVAQRKRCLAASLLLLAREACASVASFLAGATSAGDPTDWPADEVSGVSVLA